MPDLIYDLLLQNAGKKPHSDTLAYQGVRLDYGALAAAGARLCGGTLLRLGLGRAER